MSDLQERILQELAELREAIKSPAHDPDIAVKVIGDLVEADDGDHGGTPRGIAAKAIAAQIGPDPDDPATSLSDLLTTKATDDRIAEFQRLNDEAYVRLVYAQAAGKMDRLTQTRAWRDLQRCVKALDSTDTSNFVPTGFSQQLTQEARIENRLPGLFPNVTPPQSPWDWPADAGISDAYYVSENTGDNGDLVPTRDPSDNKATFRVKAIAVRNVFSYQVDFESAVPILPWVQGSLGKAMVNAAEDGIANGDTTATHFDTGLTIASNDPRRAWKGLRKLALEPSTDRAADIDGWAEADMATLRNLLDPALGWDPSELAFLMAPRTYYKMIGDTTNWPSYQSMDKIGERAINVRGEVGAVAGIPLVVSPKVSILADGGGVAITSAGTDSWVALVNRMNFAFAQFQPIKLVVIDDPETLQKKVVAHAFWDFQALRDPTTVYGVAIGYDVP